MRKLIIISIIFFVVQITYAQKTVKGIVLEESLKGTFTPIIGAPVYWIGTNDGVVTDTNGVFEIKINENVAIGYSKPLLVISYIGYQSDTIEVKNDTKIRVILSQAKTKILQEVEIRDRILTTEIDPMNVFNTKSMSEKELFKAACCNLSESFETNPSVDVNYSDAVTGAKQIQMLGLSGIYTQLTNENLPGTRGLASVYGLGYIPGPWIESIQVTKGVGSVANGFESVAGQINVELKKTEVNTKSGERLFFNAYGNDFGRMEANLNLTQKVNKNWSTTTLLHANQQKMKIDQNKDQFLDIPIGYQLNAINRWKYENNKGWLVQFGIKALKDDRIGGQLKFDPQKDYLTTNNYGVGINTERLEGFAKIGYIFPQKKYKSIGLMTSVINHQSDQYFGLTTYKSNQKSLYGNLIYQSIINSTIHKFRTGTSIMIDKYDEKLAFTAINPNQNQYLRTEIVPGAFIEYTWTPIPKLVLIGGMRVDYHNLFGAFVTPRIHGKYDLTENSQIRFSGGRGQRTANTIAENVGVLATSRIPFLPNTHNSYSYGLGMKEVAWNYGLSFLQNFKLDYRKGNITLDAYRTDFQQQLVVDYDKNPQQINFYQLNGKSYSNTAQVELNYELIKRLDLKMAYRIYDVKTTYHDELLQKPLVAQQRAFANLAFSTKNNWKLDYTLTWNGQKRIPNTKSNPEQYQKNEYSPQYFVMNGQVSKSFGNPMKQWLDIYLGVENITNFRQKDLIIASNDPFGPYFDSSLIWGSIVGRMIYIGVRFKIK